MGKGTGRGNSAGVKAWRRSERWRRIALAQALANVRAWAARPRCGATAKRTGCPCRQAAMQNGRCRWHGGRTPSGKNWHQPIFSPGTTASGTSKLDRKLYDLAQARKRREKRLSAMTPAEREAYWKWHEARDPRQSARLSRRRAKQQAIEARSILARDVTQQDPEVMRLAELIQMLEREIQSIEHPSSIAKAQVKDLAIDNRPSTPCGPTDIFG